MITQAYPDLARLTTLVREIGRDELLPRFADVARQIKADGSFLTEADLAVDERLRAALAGLWPEIGFLSEEMEADEQAQLLRGSTSPLWCLDPLDGTSNYAAGIPFFAISLALLDKGAVRIGVVYDPVRDECFTAERGQGARLNGYALRGSLLHLPLNQLVALIDFKRLTPALRERLIASPPYHSQRNFGACALEWAWVAAGRGQLLLHGGQKLWDYAAGCLLLEEVGGKSFDLLGNAVFSQDLKPRSVVASPDPRIAEDWLAWLQSVIK